jgi:hypothetical protein
MISIMADRGDTAEVVVITERVSSECLWCAAQFTLRRGGSPKKFCGARCRREFHSLARRWAEAAVAAGTLSVDVLKNVDPAAYTLLTVAGSPATVDQAQRCRSAAVAPRLGSHSTAQQDLERLMALAIKERRR